MKKIIIIVVIILCVATFITLAAMRQAAQPSAQVYCDEAISYMEKGDFKTAIDYLKKSIRRNSKYPKSQYAIAVCYLRIEPPDLKLARKYGERAKELGYQIPEWFDRRLKKLESAN